MVSAHFFASAARYYANKRIRHDAFSAGLSGRSVGTSGRSEPSVRGVPVSKIDRAQQQQQQQLQKMQQQQSRKAEGGHGHGGRLSLMLGSLGKSCKATFDSKPLVGKNGEVCASRLSLPRDPCHPPTTQPLVADGLAPAPHIRADA